MAPQRERIPIWPADQSGAGIWQGAAEEVISGQDDHRMLRNVTRPSLEVILPDPEIATGTAVITCPGGAFHFLSIDNEGYAVADWLTGHGIATFILRYRVVSTPTDEDFATVMMNPTAHRPKMDAVRPAVVEDGLQAVRLVRERATEWNIDPSQIGIIGFSAGAQASVGAATKYLDSRSRPDFAAKIYGEWWEQWIPEDAPPLFITASSNDPLIDVTASTGLYEAWYRRSRPAEIHIFSQGGHGYGVRDQDMPSDSWSERFIEWLRAEGFLPR